MTPDTAAGRDGGRIDWAPDGQRIVCSRCSASLAAVEVVPHAAAHGITGQALDELREWVASLTRNAKDCPRP